MKSRSKRSSSISSTYSDKSEFQGYSSDGSSVMASTRPRGSKPTIAPRRNDSSSDDGSLVPIGRHPADVKSTRGLTHLVQSTIAKLKKKGGCPINSIKQNIKENYGFSLTSTSNTRRLNAVLKKLQKQGTIIKTKRGFKLVPIEEDRRRQRRRHHRKGRKRGRRRRKGRGRKGKGRKGRGRSRRRRRRRRRRKGRKGRRKTKRRRGRKHHRRRRRKGRGRQRSQKGRRHHRRSRKRRRRSRGGKHANGPRARRIRGAANLAIFGGGPGPFIGGPSRGGGGGYIPRGGSPRIPSRKASRLPSRAPSRLPSRSHSPRRPGFDPCETPPTRSRRSSARASARNSPGPQLMASLDDYDL